MFVSQLLIFQIDFIRLHNTVNFQYRFEAISDRCLCVEFDMAAPGNIESLDFVLFALVAVLAHYLGHICA
jgi:hypothetical protein